MRGLTQKQERFVLEFIKTDNASEAYRRSYDVAPTTKPEVIWVKACELLKTGKVAVRLQQLRSEAAERANMDIDSITQMLKDAYDKAKAEPKGASAAVSAAMGLAKLHGLIVEKSEASVKQQTQMSGAIEIRVVKPQRE